MGKLGMLRTTKNIDQASREIREWLERIGISGLEVNINWDARQNVALLRFRYKSKNYEKRSTKQDNCRLNVCALAQFCENKVRASLQGIEDFDMSISPYLQLQGEVSTVPQGQENVNYEAYATIGIEYTASNEQLKNKYRELVKLYHPDIIQNINSNEVKAFQKKLQEINTAWSIIKIERGIT